MTEPNDSSGRKQGRSGAALPVWAVYVVTAFVWPLVVQALILAGGMAFALGPATLSRMAPVLVATAAAMVGWWIGSRLRRSGAPRRLWIVPACWAAASLAFSGFGFLVSDARDLLGLFGVAGSYVLGAVGFWIGASRGAQ